MAEILLKYGAKVDQLNTIRFDQTPLHLASLKGNARVVQLLLNNGANINLNNSNPRGPTR